ncbi:MAG TPA: cytochrome P450 [Acidobacteriaceae bacterium]
MSSECPIRENDTAPELRRPAWESDRLDTPESPEIMEAYFDRGIDAWVLSRYADVAAALHAVDLAPATPTRKEESPLANEAARLQARADVMEALSPSSLRAWRRHTLQVARVRVASLPVGCSVDLIREYAQPVCTELAVMVTGAPPQETERLVQLAAHATAAAAEPFDDALQAQAESAGRQMRPCFHAGPESLRESGFIALSQTLVRLLANGWFSLLRNPAEWSRLHRQPSLAPRAVEEMLRCAALPRILCRQATRDTRIGGAQIRAGDRVILRLVAANNDPERFVAPHRFDITRGGAGHFTLGAGGHACVGAPLLRCAAIAGTLPLVESFVAAELAGPIEWVGGTSFLSPRSLPVRLSR